MLGKLDGRLCLWVLGGWYDRVLDTIQLGVWEKTVYVMGAEEVTMCSSVIGDTTPALWEGLKLGHE